jgi:hypothetical protein
LQTLLGWRWRIRLAKRLRFPRLNNLILPALLIFFCSICNLLLLLVFLFFVL